MFSGCWRVLPTALSIPTSKSSVPHFLYSSSHLPFAAVIIVALPPFLSMAFPAFPSDASEAVNTGFHSAHRGLGDGARGGGQKQEAEATSCSGVHRGNERMRRPKKQTQPHLQGSKCQQGADTGTHFLVQQCHRGCVFLSFIKQRPCLDAHR